MELDRKDNGDEPSPIVVNQRVSFSLFLFLFLLCYAPLACRIKHGNFKKIQIRNQIPPHSIEAIKFWLPFEYSSPNICTKFSVVVNNTRNCVVKTAMVF